jgi:hypothetical protein
MDTTRAVCGVDTAHLADYYRGFNGGKLYSNAMPEQQQAFQLGQTARKERDVERAARYRDPSRADAEFAYRGV